MSKKKSNKQGSPTKGDNPRRSQNTGKKSAPSYDKSEEQRSRGRETNETAENKKPNQSYDSIRTNDISWWNKSPMYQDAVRVPFNRIYGAPISNDNVALNTDTNSAVPGVMAIDFIPTIGGTAEGANSQVNRSFTSLYGNIYSKTTGAMQFQQADLTLFMLGLTSVAYMIALVKRALGVSQFYHGQNYYYPEALLTAMGLDPSTVIGHQDEIRAHLNDHVLNFNGLKVPDFMDIYKRQFSLCHNVYVDEDDVQSQIFIFRPTHYYVYHDAPNPTPGHLETKSVPLTGVDINQWLDVINEMLEAWRQSSDLGLISGSIQRAFPDNMLIELDYVQSGDTILPVPDRNILWQINNCISIGAIPSDITQDPVLNIIKTTMKSGAEFLEENKIMDDAIFLLNSFDGVTDDEFIMEATRLMPVMQPGWASGIADLTYYGTEVVTGFELYTYRMILGVLTLQSRKFTSVLIFSDADTPTVTVSKYNFLNEVSKFKHGPRIRVLHYDSTSMFYSDCNWNGDLYKFTTVDRESLIGLNKAALQSIYLTNVI